MLSPGRRPWSLDKLGSRGVSEAIVRLVASDLGRRMAETLNTPAL